MVDFTHLTPLHVFENGETKHFPSFFFFRLTDFEIGVISVVVLAIRAIIWAFLAWRGRRNHPRHQDEEEGERREGGNVYSPDEVGFPGRGIPRRSDEEEEEVGEGVMVAVVMEEEEEAEAAIDHIYEEVD